MPVRISISGWSGRGLRTARFTAIEAACASATPAVAAIHCGRRRRSRAAPAAPTASQPAACSPKPESSLAAVIAR